MKEYLHSSEVIDWEHPAILELAKKIALEHKTPEAIAISIPDYIILK